MHLDVMQHEWAYRGPPDLGESLLMKFQQNGAEVGQLTKKYSPSIKGRGLRLFDDYALHMNVAHMNKAIWM